MSTEMNPLDEKLCEQLCAYLDGELPADEARFLERRLVTDPALQEKWQRLQLASACLKGQPFQPMTVDLCARVAVALAEPAVVADGRRPWRLWATAASIALLALAFAPRLLLRDASVPGASPLVAAVTAKVSTKPEASPASADFVAVETAKETAPPDDSAPATHPVSATPRIAPSPASPDNGTPAQAIADAAQSPAEFPLVDSGTAKSWPRAELPAAANDPSIEAYLVRHNQMLANDGLGGFVPYVDVVTNAGDKQ